MAFESTWAREQTLDAGGRGFSQPTKPPPWEYLIICDLFFAELSAGLFVTATLGDLIAQDTYGPASRVGYLLAFPIVIADLVCLVADLGDPLRFHHMLRVFKLRSPMSVGTWALSVFAFISLLCFTLATVDSATFRHLGGVIGGIGLVPALFVGGYKGVMLSATAQPGWKDERWLGAELISSAGLMGVAGLLLVSLCLPTSGAISGLRLAQIAMLFLNLVFSITFFVKAVPRALRKRLYGQATKYAVVLMVDWCLPLIFSFLGGPLMLATAASLILLGALLFRRELVLLPRNIGLATARD
jgi:Ni/Fe-hydrogenase subunit HybB-like protein